MLWMSSFWVPPVQLVVLYERSLDGVATLVIAAVGSLASEVEHRVDGEVGKRSVQV